MKTKFENIYNKLEGKYEGYIQLSNKKLSKEFVYEKKQKLKPLDIGDAFVVEACFFDGNESINIRQVNDDYKEIKAKLDSFTDEQKTQKVFYTNGYKKAKIVTIWENDKDKNCEGFDVLKPTLQLFAGFEGEEK